MKVKAKYMVFMGAFIVLTAIGYGLLTRNDIVMQVDSMQMGKKTATALGNFEDNAKVSGETNLLELPKIYVHIEGAVKEPGVKEVELGTRVYEAIALAGGATSEADTSKLNLASVLKDEQKITVPKKVEMPAATTSQPKSSYSLETISKEKQNEKNVQSGKTKQEEFEGIQDGQLVNINEASLEELQTLKGIGPAMSERILQYREENGGFHSIEEIKNVKGIGDAKFNAIKDFISV